jgi:hypothetical protein
VTRRRIADRLILAVAIGAILAEVGRVIAGASLSRPEQIGWLIVAGIWVVETWREAGR